MMARRSTRILSLIALAGLLGPACGSRLPLTELAAPYAGHDVSPGPAAATGGPSQATATAPLANTEINGSAPAPVDAAVSPATSGKATVAGAAAGTANPRAGAPAGSRPESRAASARPQAGGPTSGSAGAAPPGVAPPASVSNAPILIGTVGVDSGIVGAALRPGVPALRSWAASVNAAGGLKGHPVKVISADDGNDPARHRQLVQQMVEKDKVMAFVYNHAPLSGQSSVDYLTAKRVPVVGDNGGAQWYYESPMFFPQFTVGTPYIKAIIAGAAPETAAQGKKKLAILVCQEAQFCLDADRIFPQEAPRHGFRLVYRAQSSLTQPDFTAECLGARNAGADVFAVVADGNTASRVAGACERVGYRPTFLLGHHSALLLSHATQKPLDGMITVLPLRPWFDATNPSVAAYQQGIKTYAPGEVPSNPGFTGWVAGMLFGAAANASPDPTTSAGILEGLWALKGETLGGATHPLTFRRDQNAPQTICWFAIRIANGNFESTSAGRELRCE